jgi:predicted amidophosphoribosyltransferase
MTKNPFGVQFTKCPRCESERASLASRYCSRCGKRLVGERSLRIGWWVVETLRVMVALSFIALASRVLYSCLSS